MRCTAAAIYLKWHFRIWCPMYTSQALYPFISINYAPRRLSATLTFRRWILLMPTSRKPCMKFAGNLASGFSSSRKNFMTCGICFQKFNVSCHHAFISIDTKATSQKSTSWRRCISSLERWVSLFPDIFIRREHFSVPDTLYGYGTAAYPPPVAYWRIYVFRTPAVLSFVSSRLACWASTSVGPREPSINCQSAKALAIIVTMERLTDLSHWR